ncbi:unnamed protein product, partial [Eruca vesicaria subsp. sativa]|nr:unnamed protein product [Eruca vesicaria subsp. sativa]
MTDWETAEQVVYISCVDEEVRYSFVSHLAEALRRIGLNEVFIDCENHLSKDAKAVVERARVSVMVLPGNCDPSKEYTDKLTQVLNCNKEDDQVVVPVLYSVGTLEGEWRRVLQNMSGLSQGHESRNEDSELVKEIVRDVYEKHFSVERVGVYSKLLEIEKMVNKQPLGTRYVGIWGMPGIGKTTLAQAVFDQMYGEFDAYCFIEDYNKVYHEKGLNRLMNEQFWEKIPVPGGIPTKLGLRKHKLKKKRVLVVLDDVRDPMLAKNFLRMSDWFAPESLFIITSRDKQVFRHCSVSQIYEVHGLDETEALQLFLLCASMKGMTEQNLPMEVIKYANGNPLALNIYASELKGKKELSGMEALKQHPPSEILDAFISSYDTLSDSEKNIFLDIACFFQGENVDYVMQLLDGCGFFPHVGIDVLVDKCLVTISENRVQMHNLTRDVGRKLIISDAVLNERRSRLWDPLCIKYILEDNEDAEHEGTEEIEGMFLDTSGLSFDNLEMLKTIRLSHSQQLVDIDDLLEAHNLEVIDLQGCTRLQSFPATGQLLHLRVVNLSGCAEIKSFPEVPPNVEILQLQGTGITELPLSIVKSNDRELVNLLTDIPVLSGVSNLEQTDLESLTSLLNKGSSIQNPGKLICLDLKDCSRLQCLPNIVSLELLNVLDLSGCSDLKNIQGFPRNLKELHLAGTAVGEVPQLPQSLEVLNAHGCASLKSINLDPEKFPMHYTFSNCFSLSPQVVNLFLEKALANIKHVPRDHQQELNKASTFSFCAPSHDDHNSALDLLPGSSVMAQLNPSWRNTLVGFAMLVEFALPEDFCDATGFGISCVCRWKDKEGSSHRIERSMHFWAPGKGVPKKDHVFVFCDVKMRPNTDEGSDPDIWADLVVFEFFPVGKQKKRLDDSCTVKRCGVSAIPAAAGNTSHKMSSSGSFFDPVEFSGYKFKEVLRVRYDGLEEIDKALFLYIAGLFNDEDLDMVAPLIARIDLDVSFGLKVLANMSLIHVSSSGEILMHYLLRQMGKEILHGQSMLPRSLKEDSIGDFEKASFAFSSSCNWKYDVFPSFRWEDICKNFLNHFISSLERRLITTFYSTEIERGNAIRESNISIVVFSKNYASSCNLLNELVEIAESKKELNQIVIPLFYEVYPLDVKEQTGEFGRQFKETCKNKAEDEKQRWCQALTDIANIRGGYTYISEN